MELLQNYLVSKKIPGRKLIGNIKLNLENIENVVLLEIHLKILITFLNINLKKLLMLICQYQIHLS